MADLECWSTGRLLVLTAGMVRQAFQEFLERQGVTFAGLHVLRALRDGPRAQVEVAEWCGVQAQTVGRTIDRLVRGGLVKRERDPADGRRRLVSLTGKGRELVEFVSRRDRPTEHGPGLFGELEDEERFRAELMRLYRRLVAHQAANRAARWVQHAERLGAYDTSPGGADGPPGPRIPPRPPTRGTAPVRGEPVGGEPVGGGPVPELDRVDELVDGAVGELVDEAVDEWSDHAAHASANREEPSKGAQ